MPVILDNVAVGGKIWTDEHKSNNMLNTLGYIHDTVCHKCEFVIYDTDVNTRAVESFNIEVNLETKRGRVRRRLDGKFLG